MIQHPAIELDFRIDFKRRGLAPAETCEIVACRIASATIRPSSTFPKSVKSIPLQRPGRTFSPVAIVNGRMPAVYTGSRVGLADPSQRPKEFLFRVVSRRLLNQERCHSASFTNLRPITNEPTAVAAGPHSERQRWPNCCP